MSDPPTQPIQRALPIEPIPTVAFDAIIEEGWGDSVAQSLNNLNEAEHWLSWPAEDTGAVDSTAPTSPSFTIWIEPGDLYIPEWATQTLFQTSIEGVTEGTGGPNTYELQLSVGDVVSGHVTRITAPVGSGLWFTVTWGCMLDLTGVTGIQPVQILARRYAGSGAWHIGGEGTYFGVAVYPRFIGAVNWYGE